MTRCLSLAEALGVGKGEVVAFVGGGGKTAALLRLVLELRALEWRTIASTTTKVGRSIETALSVFEASGNEWHGALARAVARNGAVFVAAGRSGRGKWRGLDPAQVDDRLRGLADVILLEADGSRQKPIKAPGAHEPVVPAVTTLVVPMVGVDALGRTIGPSEVHRPELLKAIMGSDVVTPEGVARLMTSPLGGLKAVPAGARVRPILNKVCPDSRSAAASIARALLDSAPAFLDRVVVADIASSDFACVGRPGG